MEILKWAKAQGISITAEVTPHHLLLDDSRLTGYDGVNRVNPPLRGPPTPSPCARRWPTA